LFRVYQIRVYPCVKVWGLGFRVYLSLWNEARTEGGRLKLE
jgi:hypothetical protein